MKKGKPDVWTAIFSVELKRSRTTVTPSPSINELCPPRRFPLRSSVPAGYRTAIAAQAALLAALVATGPSEALAGKGGLGHHAPQGIPNVNLGLAQFQQAGAGVVPFVPSVSGASASTPANGLLSGSPGLRLGQPHWPGSPSVLNGPPGVALPNSAVAPPQPGNGLAPGHSDNKPNGKLTGASSASDAAMARMSDKTHEPGNEPEENGQAFPRKLPTCR